MPEDSADLIWHISQHTLPAAFALLPGRMGSSEAAALLLAIGLQESGFTARRQRGGPARGFWQFEVAGVAGVLTHPVTAPILRPLVRLCLVPETAVGCQAALEYHDVLAACCARLLCYVDARPLPGVHDAHTGWSIYVQNWRPGRPRPEAWADNYATGWRLLG